MSISTRQHGMPFAPASPDQATRLRTLVRAGPAALVAIDRAEPPVPPQPHRAAVVSISSGKGGVGKTTLCVNLAVALAELGRRTTLVDADLGLANADVLCGLSPARRLDSVFSLAGRTGSLRDIAVEAPGGFRLVPGAVGTERMTELSSSERARLLDALADLERDSDVMLIDTAAGLGRGVTAFMRAADLCLVVATPDPTSIADAYALVKCVRRPREASRHGRPDSPHETADVRPVLIVNNASGEREALAVHARLAAVAERFLGYRMPMLGWVARDERVVSAVRKRRPVLIESPNAPASRDVRALAVALARSLRAATPDAPRAIPRRGWSRWFSELLLRGG
ncbi:MAG: MinD/ParA family protein [Phycisphaerales bacterium]